MKNVMIVFVLLIAGCFESQKVPEPPRPNIKPLNQQLIPTHQNWKDAYGDTFNVQVAWNFAVLRNNQLEIAKMISKMHPTPDPNVRTLEERVILLEALGADIEDTLMGKTVYFKQYESRPAWWTVYEGKVIYIQPDTSVILVTPEGWTIPKSLDEINLKKPKGYKYGGYICQQHGTIIFGTESVLERTSFVTHDKCED